MSKLLEELAAEFEAIKPPKEAVTVDGLAKKLSKSTTYARAMLERKVKKDGWKSSIFSGRKYFWKPAD